MVTVKNANVVLEIEDDEVDKYVEKGYSVLDKFGNVIKASVPTDVGTLQKAFKDHEEMIKTQAKQIESLKKENENLLALLAKGPATSSGEPAAETKPKSSNYKKKSQQ